MKPLNFLISCCIFLWCSVTVQAQLTVTQGSAMGLTPLQLVQNQLVGQGITISNATFNGSSASITSNQIGYFTAENTAALELGIDAGVLITSGTAQIAVGPNNSGGAGAGTGTGSDPDLNIIANANTNDKGVLEFDFVPNADTLRFRYVFGSEEFFEYCNSYNDAFGFFLSGPGITGTFSNLAENIALMPNGSSFVTINNLCSTAGSNWNNAGGINFQYDGMSVVLTAWHVVIPCSTYHIKLAVADAVDEAYDSGVFLEKNSFNATGLMVNNHFAVPKFGGQAVEGCNDIIISFILSPVKTVPYQVNWTVSGDAIMGVDYSPIPDSIIIPPGQDSAGVVIHALLDGLPEPTEYVVLLVEQPSCNGIQIYHDSIPILNNTPYALIASNDTVICSGESAFISVTSNGGMYPYEYMWSNGNALPNQVVMPPVGVNTFSCTGTDACNYESTDSVTVTVKPLPVLTNSPLLDSICSASATGIGLTSSISGTTFSWTATCISPNVTGYSNGAGALIAQTLFNPGPAFDTVVYTITPVANGCTGAATVYKMVVRPKPDVIFNSTTPNLCTGGTTNISLSSTNPAASFSWTATGSSPDVSGFFDGTGNLIGQHLFNTGNTIDTVSYHVTATAPGCSGDVFTYKVVVNPFPNLTNNPLADTICSGEMTGINLVSNVAGATFSWNATLLGGSITGYNNGSGIKIDDLLINSGTAPGKVSYRIIPSANGCDGTATDFRVVVNPTPAITNPLLTSQICSGTATGITILSDVPGTTFTWTATSGSANIAGYSNGTGASINQALTNSGWVTDSVTYHVIPEFDGCAGTPKDFIVRVVPVPDAWSAPASQQICSGIATSLQLQSHVAGANFSWTASASSPNLTGFSAGTGDVIAQTLTNSGFTTETVTYLVIPASNGCQPALPLSITVTVHPVPDLTNLPLSQTQCNNLATGINLTSHVAGTLFTWTAESSSPALSGFSDNAIPASTINHVLGNAGYTNETVTYHLTPSANGCSGDLTDYTVTVVPTADLTNSPLTLGICDGNSTGISLTTNVTGTLFTWNCTPGSANVSGYSNNAVPTATLDQTLSITSVVPETVTYHITPHFNGCDGAVYDFVVTVNPVPVITTTPMHDSICSATTTDILLTSSCAGTTYTWTAELVSGNVTGFSDGTGPTIFQALTNLTNTTGIVTYHVVPTAGLCQGNVHDYTVYVYPQPAVTTAPLADSICSATTTAIALSSDVTGAIFLWTASAASPSVSGYSAGSGLTIAQTLTNSGYTSEPVIYTITPRANGCNGLPVNYSMTVHPVPDLTNNPLSKAICSGATTNISLQSNVAGTGFTWTATGSSPQVSGFSDNATPAILIDQILINTSFINQTVTYSLTPTANGCSGATYSYVVMVYPVPDLSNIPASSSQCNNLTTAINLQSNVAGTQFTWSATGSSPFVTGFSDNPGTPSLLISQLLVNSGFNTETVIYHLTPAANGCSGPVMDYTVTVFPTPDLSNTPLTGQVCNNTATNLALTSHVAGTQFTWTCTPSSANVTGWSANPVPSILLNQVLVNTGLLTESVTYHMTPSANGCDGPVTDYVMTVVQSPDVYFSPPAQTLCSGEMTAIQNLSHVTGTTFTWTATGSSPNVTGLGPGSGNVIAQTLANSGVVAETVTYTVSPEAFGCPAGLSQNVVVTVNPRPHVTNTITRTSQCSAATTAIVLQSGVAGSTFTWAAAGSSAALRGYSNGSGLQISHTLFNDGFNIDSVTYKVTPVASSCAGDTVLFQVTVFPVPDAYFTPATQAICSGQSTGIGIQSHVSGSAFTWTATGSSAQVSGYSPGSGDQIIQVLNNSGFAIETVTYAIMPSANGCSGNSWPMTVQVNPLPALSYAACFDPVTTTDAQPILLRGALPLNGTFTGTGVSANFFYPGVAGAGAHQVTYTYMNTWGCVDSASQTITVTGPAAVTCGSPFTDPRDNQQYPTIQIGTQCWMAANMNYGNTLVSSQVQRDNCLPEKFCFNDNPLNCSGQGGLYQWNEMMGFRSNSGAQGVCPPAWHVPTESEWNLLFSFYISNGFAGNPLKSTGFSGFDAFLNGVNFNNTNWNFDGFATLFWSSTSHGHNKAWAHGMNSYNPSVSAYPSAVSNSFPVRCIKD